MDYSSRLVIWVPGRMEDLATRRRCERTSSWISTSGKRAESHALRASQARPYVGMACGIARVAVAVPALPARPIAWSHFPHARRISGHYIFVVLSLADHAQVERVAERENRSDEGAQGV